MTDAQPEQSLHLPSLVIKNFRGIDELTIPRLGRVTLLAGKNGVGKTTVLDAVRIWAAGGSDSAINQVLLNRGDFFTESRETSGRPTPAYASHPGYVSPMGDSEAEIKRVAHTSAVFTNQQLWPAVDISIGTIDGTNTLQIGHRLSNQTQARLGRFALETKFGNGPQALFTCNSAGPNRPTDETIERYWNGIALTSNEDRAVEALNLVSDGAVERIALLEPAVQGSSYRRRFMAKVVGKDHPVTIRSLGDGAVRAFATALALANSTNGFLLIDEVENGIHHSVQAKFWKMVLQTAQRNNVQVLATTHSSDCAYRFGQVASELADIEGILYRIQRNGERLRAVPYPEDQLVIAAEHRIEVR